jgi:hypothetical protein
MRVFSWQVILGVILVILSAVVYFIHFLIFRDIHHIFIYFVGDVAFVFIEVLLVTLIIHEMLAVREKRIMLEKMNMVIGTFFSEVGTPLLSIISSADSDHAIIQSELEKMKDFSFKDIANVKKKMQRFKYRVRADARILEKLKQLLLDKRDFLLRLLENPNLLEHDSFTNLLWAVFHLTDELAHRQDCTTMPASDLDHLAGDVQRAYRLLVFEWLDYMKHLKESYPYLYSLAVRTNPFDPHASVEVT